MPIVPKVLVMDFEASLYHIISQKKKEDVGILPHDKKRNKKMPTPRYKVYIDICIIMHTYLSVTIV